MYIFHLSLSSLPAPKLTEPYRVVPLWRRREAVGALLLLALCSWSHEDLCASVGLLGGCLRVVRIDAELVGLEEAAVQRARGGAQRRARARKVS